MNVQLYHEQRQRKLAELQPRQRDLCFTCFQPRMTCYCSHVQTFNPRMRFVILIHPLEMRRRIATGRMSHLVLENSHLIMGYDFSMHWKVNEILANPDFHSVILYPGRSSVNLTPLSPTERSAAFPPSKELVVFVIDGTWSTARKMLRYSDNLLALPQICFSPPTPSNFRVRKQPKPECYSTLEAIHHTIELLGPACDFDVDSREHDKLTYIFDRMVEQQLEFIKRSHSWRRRSRHKEKA